MVLKMGAAAGSLGGAGVATLYSCWNANSGAPAGGERACSWAQATRWLHACGETLGATSGGAGASTCGKIQRKLRGEHGSEALRVAFHATALAPDILAYAHLEAVAQDQQMTTAAEGIIEQLAGLEQDVALELAALDHQRGHLLHGVGTCVQHASFGAQLGAGPDDPDHFHQRLCRVRWQPSFTARAQRKASRCSRMRIQRH